MSADGGNTAYRVTLPEFEGPLDLLLHLCKTHEIDIVNIPIAFITRKYLEYLEVMQSMSVDVAADYLVMAATLAYLKSRELVPTPETLDTTDEEGGSDLDPREELIRRLLEYQKYKNAAEQLGGRPIEGRTVFPRGVPIDKDDPSGRPFGDHSIWRLIEAFGKLLEKTGKAPTTHDVVVDRVSIGTRIGQLHERLRAGGGSVRFDACFDLTLSEAELRNQVVVTLLAILELARLKAVRVLQSPTDDTLFITQVSEEAMEAARHVTMTSVSGEPEAAAENAAEAAPENAAETVVEDVAEAAQENAADTVPENVAEAAGENGDDAAGDTVAEAAGVNGDEAAAEDAGEAAADNEEKHEET
jgi:segregation and condensation protein A